MKFHLINPIHIINFHPCEGLPVSLLSMLLALSGAGVLAAGVILKSYMANKEELQFYQNITDEELQTLQFYVGLIEKTEYIVIGYGAWSAFVGLMGMVTFIANFVNKYTCIFDGNCSRVILTAMYARNAVHRISSTKPLIISAATSLLIYFEPLAQHTLSISSN